MLNDMRNPGYAPPHPLVDLKFRNGVIKRGQDPKRWNWKPLACGESPYDIVSWQEVKEG